MPNIISLTKHGRIQLTDDYQDNESYQTNLNPARELYDSKSAN